jgi:hypothetical protein
LVYEGPAEGKPREEWTLKPTSELLRLKVCDMAMGSGAFLVEVIRYLSARVVEAWEQAERDGGGQLVLAPDGQLTKGDPRERVVPTDAEERLAVARRVVADRCVYGVDKNPMAVEMAKLSLWLVTLQKDKPFTFLDHALRCGDSLLGLTDPEQIRHFHIDPSRVPEADGPLFRWGARLGPALANANRLRHALESFSVETTEDARTKERLLREAETSLQDLKLVADCVISSVLETARRGGAAVDEKLADMLPGLSSALSSGSKAAGGEGVAPLSPRPEARGLPASRHGSPFHWVLEFPEVVGSGGFDAFVGNPPFMYGTKASSSLSEGYVALLAIVLRPWHAKADLCAAFLRRAADLSADGGKVGLVLSASVVRGETLDSGVRPLLQADWQLISARSPFVWPGAANVDACWFVVSRNWQGSFFLDEKPVATIGEDLVPHTLRGEPSPLATGTVICLMGVKLSPANAPGQSRGTPNLPNDALVPAVGGDELNSLVDLSESPLAVDPSLVPDPRVRERFVHSRPAMDLMTQLKDARCALACAETSVHLAIARVPARGMILRHKLFVFPYENWWAFGFLQSAFHQVWAMRWGLRRRSWLTYSAKRVARTLVLPDTRSLSALEELAQELYTSRQDWCRSQNLGLTAFYNTYCDEDGRSPIVSRLRDMHVAVDRSVAQAYGWSDLKLDHGFYRTEQGVRFTVSDVAQREILERLLVLNQQRHAEEAKQGLHHSERPASPLPADLGKARQRASKKDPANKATSQPSRQTGFNFNDD